MTMQLDQLAHKRKDAKDVSHPLFILKFSLVLVLGIQRARPIFQCFLLFIMHLISRHVHKKSLQMLNGRSAEGGRVGFDCMMCEFWRQHLTGEDLYL